MQLQTADEVIARIEREGGPAGSDGSGRGVVAFDADGTLWSGDVGDDFVHAMIAHGDLREPAIVALRGAARAGGLDPSGAGATLLRRVIEAFEAHAFPEDATYAATTWLCAGWRRDEIAAFVRETIARAALPSRLHRECVRVVAWARANGFDVRVVSASPQHVVEEAVRCIGLEAHAVIASRAAYEGDVMRAAVDPPMPYAAGKVDALRVRAQCTDGALVAAFGDNAFDAPMLAASRVPVAVRPKPRLRELGPSLPALVELTREA